MECVSLTLSVQNSLPLVPLVSPTANTAPPAEEGRRGRTQIQRWEGDSRRAFSFLFSFLCLATMEMKQPAAAVTSLHLAASAA